MDEQPTVEQLWQVIQEQRELVRQQKLALDERRVEVEQLRAEVRRQRATESGKESCPAHEEDSVAPSDSQKVSRGRLVKLVAAGIAGAAGVGVLGPRTALASCKSGAINPWYSAVGNNVDQCAHRAAGQFLERNPVEAARRVEQ